MENCEGSGNVKCEGVGDWLKCLKCSLICSNKCPLEAENVYDALWESLLATD